MALDNTAWFIGGGATHSPEIARLLAYASTSGAEGVVEPASLRVFAQTVPNGTVAVRPGAALILNKYAGGGQQTYALRNATTTSVAIPATGSGGGRTDAIVARVLDPQYEGAAPSDPVTFQYSRLERIASVPSGLTDIKTLGLTYPAILLARVNIPASTGTITNAMITDLREVAIPRRKTDLRTVALVSSDGVAHLSDTSAYPGGQTWPIKAEESFGALDIPLWATRCKIIMTWAGIRVPPGDAYGGLWVQVGTNAESDRFQTQSVSYDGSGTTSVSRVVHIVADERPIPASMRGTSRRFYPRGNKSVTVGASQRWQLDAGSAVILQVEFIEQAD